MMQAVTVAATINRVCKNVLYMSYATICMSTTKIKEVDSMATEALQKRTLTTLLDNGTDSEGKQKTVSVAMNFFGGIDKSTWDADKALAIVSAAEPCLNKTVYLVQTGTTSTISAS